jgi:hypothetical protein
MSLSGWSKLFQVLVPILTYKYKSDALNGSANIMSHSVSRLKSILANMLFKTLAKSLEQTTDDAERLGRGCRLYWMKWGGSWRIVCAYILLISRSQAINETDPGIVTISGQPLESHQPGSLLSSHVPASTRIPVVPFHACGTTNGKNATI